MSIILVVAGMIFLALSLVARYHGVWAAAMPTSWLGAILVIFGVCRMMFLDK